MARIIWAEPALQDLDQIADYIALDDPVAAVKLVRKVFEKIELLKQFPELCPVVQDLPSDRYRHLVVGPLRIFHRVEGSRVFIVYVMRAEQKLQPIILTDRDE